jgi:hypothetical protein
MPTYLIHGFRWHRQSIRIHVILNDLEDATPEWVLAPATSMSILNSLYTTYDFLPPSNPPAMAYAHIPIPPVPDDDPYDEPERPMTAISTKSSKLKKSRSMVSLRSRSKSIGRKSKRPADLAPPPLPNGYGVYGERKGSASNSSDNRPSTASRSTYGTKPEKKTSFNDWSAVKLLEQYDPNDMKAVSQPYAYVADFVLEVSLGVSITEEMAKYDARTKAEEAPLSPTSIVTNGDFHHHDRNGSMSMREIRRKSRRLGWFEKLRDGLQNGEEIGWHVVVCGDEERASPSIEDIRGRLGVDDDHRLRTPRSAGFKGFFRKRNSQEEEK